MYHFGKHSKSQIETLNPKLILLLNQAIKIVDFRVEQGWRGKTDQNQQLKEGDSHLSWPNSKHNRMKLNNGKWNNKKSDAVDILPSPVIWPNLSTHNKKEYAKYMGRFYHLAGIVKGIALQMTVDIIWGGDWESFFDGPHIELKLK